MFSAKLIIICFIGMSMSLMLDSWLIKKTLNFKSIAKNNAYYFNAMLCLLLICWTINDV